VGWAEASFTTLTNVAAAPAVVAARRRIDRRMDRAGQSHHRRSLDLHAHRLVKSPTPVLSTGEPASKAGVRQQVARVPWGGRAAPGRRQQRPPRNAACAGRWEWRPCPARVARPRGCRHRSRPTRHSASGRRHSPIGRRVAPVRGGRPRGRPGGGAVRPSPCADSKRAGAPSPTRIGAKAKAPHGVGKPGAGRGPWRRPVAWLAPPARPRPGKARPSPFSSGFSFRRARPTMARRTPRPAMPAVHPAHSLPTDRSRPARGIACGAAAARPGACRGASQ